MVAMIGRRLGIARSKRRRRIKKMLTQKRPCPKLRKRGNR
jgi:hypothetical protein